MSMNTNTIIVDSDHEIIQKRITSLKNQADQLTHTVFNRYIHRTSMYTSVGAQTHATGRVPGESAKVDHATTSTQTTFFFAPEASRVDVSIFYTGTWFFIQKQVWCLLENLVPVQIHDMHAFTSALGGMVNGVKCIGLARLLGHKNKPHGNNDTYIRAVMVTAGEIIILPSVYTLKYNTLHPRAKYISSR
jgi:hypothetical protein